MTGFFYLTLIFIGTYLLGSFPTAYLVVKGFSGQDIRKLGSGNVGALNVYRITGKISLFGLTLAIDVAKGALAVLIPSWLAFLGYDGSLALTAAGFGLVLGHCYSLFLKFQGGKAQASLIGILGVLSWQWLLLPWGGVALFFVLTSGYLLLGQVAGTISLPIIAYFLAPDYFWPCLLMAIPIFLKQWPRIILMFKGQEPKWYWKIPKNKKSE